jgi:hypothetical protein
MTSGRRPLQVSRSLLNGPALRAWAETCGVTVTVPDDLLHVTIAYSRTPVDWNGVGLGEPRLEARGGARRLELLGFRGHDLVLSFASPELVARWRQICDAGATWDWPRYQPHVTLAYDLPAAALPSSEWLAAIVPYDGPLLFGPERFAPVTDGYSE